MSNDSSSRASKGAAGLLIVVATILAFPMLGIVQALVFGGPILRTADAVSDSVGATAAQFRVDESGAATYSIPIYAVPGRTGVAPSLTLSYSSQGGDGPMGKGWSIGGLSSISRCRATREAGDFIVNGVATDGVADPVDFSASDRFCLDGQRLVPGTEACGAAGGYTGISYRTEIDGFSRVCAWGPTAQDPRFFTVTRRDGSATWFGDRDTVASANRPDGYFNSTAPGFTTYAVTWAPTRMQDSAGNTIDYKWLENPSGAGNGELLLSEVQYTGKVPRPGTTGATLAPFTKIVFNYTARAATDWTLGFVAGGVVRSTRYLTSVVSCADMTCTGATRARYYALGYNTSGSNSGVLTLTSVKECRDLNISCLAPTTFTWSTAKNELATFDTWQPTTFGSMTKFEGYKLGDVDGDGRPDMVWLKDGSSGETCPTEHIMVAFSTFNGTRQTFRDPVLAGCTPSELMTGMGSESWQLFDYNGDGRDDFMAAGALGANYVIYASLGDGPDPFGSTNLLANVPIPVTYVANGTGTQTHPLLTDFNGDGLLDALYKGADGPFRVRLMTRQGATWGWGAERTISFTTAQPLECPPEAVVGTCSKNYGSLILADKTRLVDFDGDAASDVIFQSSVSYKDGTESCFPGEECGNLRTAQFFKFAGRVKSITATNIEFVNIGDDPVLANNQVLIGYMGQNLQFGDVNGDGLTDMVYVNGNANPDGNFVYALNTGRGFLDYVNMGLVPRANLARLVDINGDARADLAYIDGATGLNAWVWKYRPALRAGGYAAPTIIPGNNAVACLGNPCDPNLFATMFNDLDGDGALDYFAIGFASSTPNFLRSQSTSVGKPRDVITSVVNGLGSRTDIQYGALTNGKVHVRRNNSRDAFNSGRGAPTLDFLAPMYVVAKASSSAPIDGDPAAMASLYYRYAGARLQGGGRGFLGFEQVVSFDPNRAGFVMTATNYEQRFPYTGMPTLTTKSFSSAAFAQDSCLDNPKQDVCFADPGAALPAVATRTFSQNTQVYESDTDSTGTTVTAFVPGVQKPVHVRTRSTSERLWDPAPTTPVPTGRVETAFTYGANGNVATTQADTYTTLNGVESLTATILTNNVYVDNNHYWWLGRLTGTLVTHRRPGMLDVVRNTAFTYDANAFLNSERIQPGVADQDLRKQKTFDVYGNITASMTCANPSTGCDTSINFHPTDPLVIERYARTVYDAESRYPIATYEPFWSGTATIERQTAAITSRDLFGNVTQATDVNGNISAAQFGALGRPYATWTETGDSTTPGTGGVTSTVTYRWCGTGTNKVACPDGASYRVRNWSDAGPMSWSYFDVVGREVMTVKETFNTAVVNKELSAVCTAYEESGKASRVTNPFFVSGAAANIDTLALTAVCLGKPSTQTVYDVLGRVQLTTGPDGSQVSTLYQKGWTTVTDARGNKHVELRNGKGELVKVDDAIGGWMLYYYYADGTLKQVTRQASASRGLIANGWTYDALGRKTRQNDPDAGASNYAYNAAGELIAQWDDAGNRIDYAIDARGRTWKKTVTRGSDGYVESQATTVFDTAAGGVGKVASEDIVGQYTGLAGQTGTEIDFQREFGYDLMGRPVATTTTIDGVPYSSAVVYDAKSRPFRSQDVSGKWTKTEYNARGFARAICDSSDTDNTATCASTWQRTLETDAFGHTLRESRAPGATMSITRTYDPTTGRLTQLCANLGAAVCDLMNDGYGWDANGNLHTLLKENRSLETFEYDDLDRLTKALVNGTTVSQAYVYDSLGNICRKQEWNQTYDYIYYGRAGCGADGLPGGGTTSTIGPHQLAQVGITYLGYDDHGNQVTKTRSDTPGTWKDRGVRYTLDDHAYEIALGDFNGLPIQSTRFWYGTDGARYKRVDGGRTTLYLGNVEVITDAGVTTFRRYVGDVVQDVVGGVASTRYGFKDQLGSIVKIVDGAGTVVQTRDFDAFGEKRDVNNVFAAPSGPITPEYTSRGFTGHETIDGTYMTYAVHMGGRLYDSSVGRFMQADPVIQSPNNVQSWNAYTYVFNNPLTYTDPTGMWGVKEQNALRMVGALAISIWTGGLASGLWTVAGASGTAAAGWIIAGGFVAGALTSGTLKGGILGAFTALVTMSVGAYATAAELGDTARVGLQALAGGILDTLQGGNFGHAFIAAGLTAAVMPQIGKIGSDVGRTVVGAIVGGAISGATGGKFANGAISGAIQGAMASTSSESELKAAQRGGAASHNAPVAVSTDLIWKGTDPFGVPVPFASWDEALAAARNAIPFTGEVWEYGGVVAPLESGGWVATAPVSSFLQDKLSVLPGAVLPSNAGRLQTWIAYHNHPYIGESSWVFSPDDVNLAERHGLDSVIFVRDHARLYDPQTMAPQAMEFNGQVYMGSPGTPLCTPSIC